MSAAAALPESSLRYGVVPRDTLLAEDGLSFLHGLIEGRHPAPPFSRATRILLKQVERGRVLFSGVPTDDFFNPLGVIHGGWTAALMDSALGCAVHTTLAVGEGYTTVEFKLNLVRPVMPALGEITCEGVVVHRGSTIATSEGKVFDGAGKLIAHGTETCMIFGARRP